MVRLRQVDEKNLAKIAEENLGSVVVNITGPTVERSEGESSREEARESGNTSSNTLPSLSDAPLKKNRHADAEVKVEVNPNSAHISLEEVVMISAVFAEIRFALIRCDIPQDSRTGQEG